MEVIKVSLDELEGLTKPESVALAAPLPTVKVTPQQAPTPDWIDLGDEGRTLYTAADLVVPEAGKQTSFALATASGEERVSVGIDEAGHLTARLYEEIVTGPKLEPGSRHTLLIRLHRHQKKAEELFVQLGSPGEIPTNQKTGFCRTRKE